MQVPKISHTAICNILAYLIEEYQQNSDYEAQPVPRPRVHLERHGCHAILHVSSLNTHHLHLTATVPLYVEYSQQYFLF